MPCTARSNVVRCASARVPCRCCRRPAVYGVVHRGRHRDRMVAAQGLELRRQSVRCFVGHRSDHSQRMVSRYALLRRQITKRWPLLLVVSRARAPVKKIEHLHTIRDRVVIAQNAGVVAVMQRSSGIQAAHGIVPRPHAVCAAHPRSSVNARARKHCLSISEEVQWCLYSVLLTSDDSVCNLARRPLMTVRRRGNHSSRWRCIWTTGSC